MRKDTSFGEGKLTREEFAAKYWKGGDPNYIYQYHTMDIEDGRDEREQLLINNIRALWNARDFDRRLRQDAESMEVEKKMLNIPESRLRPTAYLELVGAEEALKKLDMLYAKLKECQELIREISCMGVELAATASEPQGDA